MKRKPIVICINSLWLLLLICSCNNPATREPSNQTDTTLNSRADTIPVNEMAAYHFQYTIFNLPPIMQVLDEFSKSGLPVEIGLLNSTDNASNYQTSSKKALNYGIYGVDLGYLVVNNRTVDSYKYYDVVKKISDELNTAETFNTFKEYFEKNKDNKDSLVRIIDQIYAATDTYLRSNERLETASLILAGSWLECQNLNVNLLKNSERNAGNEVLFQRVWEQRLYSENISKLLQEFKNEKELNKVKQGFEKLLALYKEPKDAKDINKDFLAKLSQNINTVRSGIIN